MRLEAQRPTRLGNSENWLSLTPNDGRLDAAFQACGLQGRWTTDLVELTRTAGELQALHDSLEGRVLLSDNASLGIHFEANKLGHVTADIHIEGWPFKVEGHIKMVLLVDHAELANLSTSLSRAAE